MRVLAVIPARYGSTRFEGKPLADILGKPMIQRVYEGVLQSKLIEKIVVATDDRRIFDAVLSFGGTAMMTSAKHATGTDRVAEVCRKTRAEIVVNVQGDEPLITGTILDQGIRPLLSNPALPMSTLLTELRDPADWISPNTAKVVVDQKGFALYFSRSPIPFPRDLRIAQVLSHPQKARGLLPSSVFKHIGVYVFRREFLFRYCRTKPTPLEEIEKLEQLRVLESGYRVKTVLVDYEPVCVDTPEDIQKVIRFLSRSG